MTAAGRHSPDTAYRTITKRQLDIEWSTHAQADAFDWKSDGMYALITNDRNLALVHRPPA